MKLRILRQSDAMIIAALEKIASDEKLASLNCRLTMASFFTSELAIKTSVGFDGGELEKNATLAAIVDSNGVVSNYISVTVQG